MTNLSSRRYLNISISKAHAKADIRKRLQECLEQPGNQTCVDCPEPNPTWASLLPVSSSASTLSSEGKGHSNHPHKKKKKKIGVFCCYKCCSYHFQLGREVCLVKNVKITDDWTEDEVKAVEGSGNEVINAVYEAKLSASEKKRLEGLKGKEEQKARAKFVEDKYKQLKFFCQDADQRHLSKLDSDEDHHHEGNNSPTAPPHGSDHFGTSSSFPTLPLSHNAGQQQSSSCYGSNAFMNRLMEKSTAGIEPKSATGLDAWGHISCNEEENAFGYSPQQDLGYGSDHNNITSEELDLGYEDTSAIQEEVARELSRRAMCRTLSSRRGSLGRSSIGSRQDSFRNVGRSNSRGSLVGDDSERQQSFRSRGQGRRGSLGGDVVSDNQGYEQQQSFKNRGRRGSLGGSPAVPENLGYESQESFRGRWRRGSLGGEVLDQKICEKQESFKCSGRRGSIGGQVLDNKGYERQQSFQSSGRRGSLGGVAAVDNCSPEEHPGSSSRSEKRCRRRGSVGGAVSVENQEYVGNRRRRGSVGTSASTESTDDDELPARAFQTTRRRRSSVGAGSVRRSNSSVSHGSCAADEKPRRRADRRGSIGRRGSLGGGSNSQKSDHDLSVDPGKKGHSSKKGVRPSGGSRRGSVGGASKSSESRPSKRNSLGVLSTKSSSPGENGKNRTRRRCSIGMESYSTAPAPLSTC